MTTPIRLTPVASFASSLCAGVAASPRFLMAPENMSDGHTKMRAVPNTAPLREAIIDKSVNFHANSVVHPSNANVVWFRNEIVRRSLEILRRSKIPSLVPAKNKGYLSVSKIW